MIGILPGAVPDEMGDVGDGGREGGNASGEVRRDGVTSSDPPLSRRLRERGAEGGGNSSGKRKAWLSPPSSTAMRGWGSGSIVAAKLCAAPARRAAVTLCTAPKVVTTFSPVKPSWSGAAIRSKRCGGTFGF